MLSLRNIARYRKTRASKDRITFGQFQPDAEIAEAMAHPDWEPIETHYDCKVSEHLKRHYSDRDRLFTADFEVASPWVRIDGGCHVGCFSAINDKSVDGFFEGLENYIEIASGILGGRFIVDPREKNPFVYLHYWDIGRDPEWFQNTGLRLKQFLFNPRYSSDREEQFEIYE